MGASLSSQKKHFNFPHNAPKSWITKNLLNQHKTQESNNLTIQQSKKKEFNYF
jgi:hypothetical protein